MTFRHKKKGCSFQGMIFFDYLYLKLTCNSFTSHTFHINVHVNNKHYAMITNFVRKTIIAKPEQNHFLTFIEIMIIEKEH